jgi:hypothetical protein
MNKEFIPYEQILELKELGFNGILWQEAFRWFREKYGFTYSIGNTNIAVVHYLGTTQLLQGNDTYEAAELAAIKWFIEIAKQQ